MKLWICYETDREWPQTKLWTPASLNPRCCRCEGADRRNSNQNVFVLRNISNLAPGLFWDYLRDVRQPCLWQPWLVSSIKQYTGGLPHLTSPHLTSPDLKYPVYLQPTNKAAPDTETVLAWSGPGLQHKLPDQIFWPEIVRIRPGQTRVTSLYEGRGQGRRGSPCCLLTMGY